MEFELIKDGAAGEAFFSYARQQQAEKEKQDPIIGDTVHVWFGGACRAAIITQDDLDTWCVSFLMPGETSWRPVREVSHDETKGDGMSWHWPCGGQ